MKTPIDDVLVAALQAENRCLRADLAAAQEEAQYRGFLVRDLLPYQERAVKAETDLAAARALLGEVREWIPYYRWIPDLRERVDAIIGKKTP